MVLIEHLTVVKFILGAAHEMMRQDRDLYVFLCFSPLSQNCSTEAEFLLVFKDAQNLILRLRKCKNEAIGPDLNSETF